MSDDVAEKLSSAIGLVTAIYQGVLRREPDESGLEYYSDALINKKFSIAELIQAFLASKEFQTKRNLIATNPPVAGEPGVYFQGPTKQSGPYEAIVLDPSVFGESEEPYMGAANCLASHLLDPRYKTFCETIAHPPVMHRKYWEFAFITHHLEAKGVLRSGAKGLGFGVGAEPLPALFARFGCDIMATDAPPGVADEGWSLTNQHSRSRMELFRPAIVERDVFDKHVNFEFADMNAIDDHLQGFDFCWSSCCFEHLGSIERGLDFVEASVEKTLKVGGVACHTSELNVTSNEATVEAGGTVLFRRKDIELLIDRLEKRGHRCERLPIKAGLSFIDFLADVPPFGGDMHLKIRLDDFVSTSFGIVVTRGN